VAVPGGGAAKEGRVPRSRDARTFAQIDDAPERSPSGYLPMMNLVWTLFLLANLLSQGLASQIALAETTFQMKSD
jgi:hypothetical protein